MFRPDKGLYKTYWGIPNFSNNISKNGDTYRNYMRDNLQQTPHLPFCCNEQILTMPEKYTT